MSCLSTKRMETSKNANTASKTSETLPELFARLGKEVLTLLEAKLGLLKLEVVEDIRVLARNSVLLVVGGVAASVGAGLLGMALGFALSTLMPAALGGAGRYAAGFAVVALAALLAGGLLILASIRRLREGVRPERSLKEIELDKRWIAKQRLP